MAELEMTETTEPTEKREQSLLNLICYIGAALFLALVAYNLFAAGSVISTDGLFFTVVPLFLALCFLVVPGMDMLAKRKAAKALEGSGETAEGAAHKESAHTAPVEEGHFAGSKPLFPSGWVWVLLRARCVVFLRL